MHWKLYQNSLTVHKNVCKNRILNNEKSFSFCSKALPNYKFNQSICYNDLID
jgi:hypothetical protein